MTRKNEMRWGILLLWSASACGGIAQQPGEDPGGSSGTNAARPVGSGPSSPAGGATATSSTSPCETACIRDVFTIRPTLCGLCHNGAPGGIGLMSGGLDLKSAGFTARLKDVPALHSDLAGGMSAADCPVGDKLIDSANPAQSWLLKKIEGQQGNCGNSMPLAGSLTFDQKACVESYVACVAAE